MWRWGPRRTSHCPALERRECMSWGKVRPLLQLLLPLPSLWCQNCEDGLSNHFGWRDPYSLFKKAALNGQGEGEGWLSLVYRLGWRGTCNGKGTWGRDSWGPEGFLWGAIQHGRESAHPQAHPGNMFVYLLVSFFFSHCTDGFNFLLRCWGRVSILLLNASLKRLRWRL